MFYDQRMSAAGEFNFSIFLCSWFLPEHATELNGFLSSGFIVPRRSV